MSEARARCAEGSARLAARLASPRLAAQVWVSLVGQHKVDRVMQNWYGICKGAVGGL